MNRLYAATLPMIALILVLAGWGQAQGLSAAGEQTQADEAAFEAGDEAEGEGWQVFESEDGRFEVLLPAEPQFKESVRDTAFGDIKEKHYELTAPEGEFSAEYNDLPLLVSLLATDRMIYRRAKDAMLKEFKAEETAFGGIEQDGIEGMELSFETKDRRGRARLFMKKRRLYVLVATVSRKDGDEANVLKFLDSFDLTGKRYRKPHKYIRMQQTGRM